MATAGEHPQLGPLCNRHLACQCACACVFLSLTMSYMRANAWQCRQLLRKLSGRVGCEEDGFFLGGGVGGKYAFCK